jgi:WD40 repeat protein
VQIWDTSTSLLLHTLPAHHKEVYALEFAPDRRTLISASGDRTLLIWDISSLSGATCTEPLPNRTLSVRNDASHPDTGICALAVSPDGRHVAAGAINGTVRVWDLQGEGTITAEWNAHAKAVYGARFILQGAGLVTASLDRTLKRWDLGSPDVTCLRTLEGHKVCPALVSTEQQ